MLNCKFLIENIKKTLYKQIFKYYKFLAKNKQYKNKTKNIFLINFGIDTVYYCVKLNLNFEIFFNLWDH